MSQYSSNMYNFVFQGNGIIELEHSNIHANGTPDKNKTSPYKFTSCVELILMVLLKHYRYIFFSPLKFSCQMNDEHSIYSHLSSRVHDRLCLREEWLPPTNIFQDNQMWCDTLLGTTKWLGLLGVVNMNKKCVGVSLWVSRSFSKIRRDPKIFKDLYMYAYVVIHTHAHVWMQGKFFLAVC